MKGNSFKSKFLNNDNAAKISKIRQEALKNGWNPDESTKNTQVERVSIVLKAVVENGKITRSECAKLTETTEKTAALLLERLTKHKLLRRVVVKTVRNVRYEYVSGQHKIYSGD